MRESAVMISSTIPSAKYSCSGSPLRLAKGNTAIDGLSGSGSVGGRCVFSDRNAVNPYRPRDVFEALFADIGKLGLDLGAHLAERVVRYADAAGLGDAFEPRGDVDAVAVDVAVLDDDVAEVDADPEGDPFLLRCRGIALDHRSLHGERAGDRLDHARELDQQAVAGRLDDSAVVPGYHWIDQLSAMGVEPRERAFLVLAHQPAVAGDIGREDRRQPALDPLPFHDDLLSAAPSLRRSHWLINRG